MFKPEEIIFAPTAECNLVCSHCRVTRIPNRLETAAAVAFMKSCRPHGVERVRLQRRGAFSAGRIFSATSSGRPSAWTWCSAA